MTRQRILVVTDDALGERMAGPAIRAWNIADVLADEHDVRLASTLRSEASSPRFAVCEGSGDFLVGLAKDRDVIITQGYTLQRMPWLAHTGAKLVVDLYDPMHLENLEALSDRPDEEQSRNLAGTIDALTTQTRLGDFFVCASEKQRDLWLGYLSAVGRINLDTYRQDPTLRRLIDVAPFGLDPTPPSTGPALKGVVDGIGPDDTVLLWAGGVYNWFDPVTLVQAVADLADRLPQVKLVFLGTEHPSGQDHSTVVLRRAVAAAAERGVLDRSVFFLPGWVPYQERGRYLTDADLGVSTHLVHAETAFAFRTRMLDYLWAGLPVICTDGDGFADLVGVEGLGRVVPPQDRAALAEAIADLVLDPAGRAAASAAAAQVAVRFRWATALAPLVEYCRDPSPAPDRPQSGAPALAGRRLAARSRHRVGQVREYIRVNGFRRFVVRGARKVVGVPARLLRRIR